MFKLSDDLRRAVASYSDLFGAETATASSARGSKSGSLNDCRSSDAGVSLSSSFSRNRISVAFGCTTSSVTAEVSNGSISTGLVTATFAVESIDMWAR